MFPDAAPDKRLASENLRWLGCNSSGSLGCRSWRENRPPDPLVNQARGVQKAAQVTPSCLFYRDSEKWTSVRGTVHE